MTREQIETILKAAGAKSDKEGGHALPEGSNVTFHVAHDGASLSLQKIESVRFEGELLHAKSSKQTVTIVASDVFAVAVEGAGGSPARRPAGFL
jgi:anti-sigma-K factor RskA